MIYFQALADIVSQADLDQGSLYPPLEEIQNCSVKIAKKIVEHAYQIGEFFYYNLSNWITSSYSSDELF